MSQNYTGAVAFNLHCRTCFQNFPSFLGLGPIDVDYLFYFCTYLAIFVFFFSLFFGHISGFFWKVFALQIYFWGWGQIQKLFGTYLCILPTLVLVIWPYLFNSNVAPLDVQTGEPPADYSRINIPSRSWIHVNV